MKRVSKNLLTMAIAGLLIACVLAAYLTRDTGRAASKQPAPNTASPIDERLEQTARQMNKIWRAKLYGSPITSSIRRSPAPCA
jgi:hypothetical protein